MRRVSYQFPRTFDSSILVRLPFSRCLERLCTLSSFQDNFRSAAGAVKREISLQIACNRLDFEPVLPQTLSGITDEADFLLTISDTVLRADGHRPEPAQKFMVKVIDRGGESGVYVAHATEPRALSANTAAEYIVRVMQ